MQRLKNVALLAGSLAAALLVSELVVRMVYTPSSIYIDAFQLRTSSYYQPDPELLRIPRPNVTGVHERKGRFTSTFSTNAVGLRDRDHPFEKPAGTTRIAVLGDSFAWGFGVNDGEVFTDVLETRLSGVEVINLGVTSFGLEQEARYFERLGQRYDPDILLLAFVQNDVYATLQPLQPAEATDPEASRVSDLSDKPAGAGLRFKRFLASEVRLYRLLVDALNANRAMVRLGVRLGLKRPLSGWEDLDPNLMPALRHYPPGLQTAWNRTTEQLRAMRDLAAERGMRFIVAMVPVRQAVNPKELKRYLTRSVYWVPDFDLDKPYADLEAFGQAEGIEVVSVLDRFRSASAAGRRLYLPDDMHYTADGHGLFAEEIAAYLAGSPTP